MIEKFKNIPSDLDTRILATKVKRIGDYDVAYQKWTWDGAYGESIIFYNEDVKSLTKEEVLELAHKADFVDFEGATYSKVSTHTFVNFNFDIGR